MATDTFAGSGALTAPWTTVVGSFNQTGGACYANSGGASSFAVNTTDGVLGDQEAEVIMDPSGSGQFIGPAVRGSNSAHTGAAVDGGSDGIYINTWAAGSFTNVVGPITAPAAGTAVKLRATGTGAGNQLRLYFNGVEQTGSGSPWTVGTGIPNTGYTGLSGYSSGTGTGAASWTGTNLGAAGPTITGTGSASPANGSSLVITGTDFGASQGTKDLRIGGIVQSVTSWADTSITVTVSRGTNKYGAALDVEIWDTTLVSNSFALTSITPPSGWAFVDIGTPNPTASMRITAVADLASGDQLAYETVGSEVEVFDDASFSAGAAVTEFDVEAWTTGDGWGAAATQIVLSVQFARPATTVSAGSWTPTNAATLHEAIDETAASETDFISTVTAADACVVSISEVTDPASSSDHIVRYRLRGDGDSGITVELMEGASVIATWTHDPAPASYTTYEQTLSGGEADAITDYSALRLRFTEI